MLLRGKKGGGFISVCLSSLVCVCVFLVEHELGKERHAPICPTMLKPVGKSSCSLSGSMALMMSSARQGNEPLPFFPNIQTNLCFLCHTYIR